jgi:hypothetical protein
MYRRQLRSHYFRMLDIVKAGKHNIIGNTFTQRFKGVLQIGGSSIVAANYGIGFALL